VSLRRVVAAPFLRRDTKTVTRAEFIYSLTADLGWFDPDEAEEALERGFEEDLLVSDGDDVRAEFDVTSVDIPDGWSPDADSLEADDRNTNSGDGIFEHAVERLVGAGYDKREAVAEINRRHADMGNVKIEAAALVVAKSEGLRVADLADEALEKLRG
jgi:hypothetical protein